MNRPVVPISLDLYQKFELTDEISTVDFYISDLMKFEEWEELKTFPTTQTWCPLNSFNMPNNRVVVDLADVKFRKDNDNIEVVCLQGGGDILMSTAFIKQFAETFPDKEIHISIYDKYKNLVEDNKDISVIHSYTPQHPNDLFARTINTDKDISPRIYNTHAPRGLRHMVMDLVERGWGHLDWMGLIYGVKIDKRETFLDEDYTLKVKNILGGIQGKIIGLHPYASIQEKSNCDLLDIISNVSDINFILLGGKDDHYKSMENVLDLSGKLSFRESLALLNRVDAIICVDSIVAHLSALTKTPTLVLFNNLPITWCGVWGDNITTKKTLLRWWEKDEQEILDWISEKLS